MVSHRNEDPVPPDEISRALERVLDSATFAQSNRLSKFLRFAVEQTLKGEGASLKEYTIGTNAYGRKTDFDPSQDTIVRTEAVRLRRKLEEYYKTEGEDDGVLIFFRSGSYVPVVRWRNGINGHVAPPQEEREPAWAEGDGIHVAVAPFEAHPSDVTASMFAFGVTEELLHRLSRVPGLHVVSRAKLSAPMLHGTEAVNHQRRQIVQIVISGSIRSQQERLRMTARVATASGLLLWSQRFDAHMTQSALLELQESVAAAILSRVSPQEAVLMRSAGVPAETLYRLYAEILHAETLLEEGSIPSVTAALAKFEALSGKEADYARSHCGVAQCCVALTQRGVYPSEALVKRATEECRKALAIDSEMIEAHSTLGCALAQEWQWTSAEESFRAALRLGDQHSTHRQFGQFLLVHSRFEESWKHLQIAQEIDSFSLRQKASVARFLFCSGWEKEATEHYANPGTQETFPPEPAYFRALHAIRMGQSDRALAIAEDLRRQVPGIPSYLAGIAEIFALCKEKQRAQSLLDQVDLSASSSTVSYFRQATLALAFEERDEALKHLEQSLRRKEPDLPWIGVDPRFDAVRKEQAYLSVHHAVFADTHD